MTQTDLLTQEFERQRPHLRTIAYRMLGSVSEAEDAVQESWVRLNRTDSGEISNLGGWLTTVVARVSLDMLRARRARREEYVGTWLPEPVVSLPDAETDPEHEALLADAVGIAMLVVLETLAPAERVAFVLHDMFAVPFDEIAPIVGRSPAATRQLASRGRRRVQGATPEAEANPRRHREIVSAFLAASRAGDFDTLLSLLDPDVELYADVGPGRQAQEPIRGAEAVARRALTFGPATARFGIVAEVNGAAGLVIAPGGRVIGVVGVTTANGRIVRFDVVADPGKLGGVTIDAG
jgi:RNA polymerase sigma factor (sigma-70 family)